MSRLLYSPRFKAFFIHFLISILCLSVFLAFALLYMYPSPLYYAVGSLYVFLVLFFSGIILGPVCTLIVFDKKKKNLKADIIVICLAQILLVSYGVKVIIQSRPVWIVYNKDRFDLIRASDVDKESLSKAAREYSQLPWLGPEWVAALPPSDTSYRSSLLLEAVMGGADIPQRPNLYLSLNLITNNIVRDSHGLDELYSYNSSYTVKEALKSFPEADCWVPMMAPVKSMVVLLNRKNEKILGVVNLQPWL